MWVFYFQKNLDAIYLKNIFRFKRCLIVFNVFDLQTKSTFSTLTFNLKVRQWTKLLAMSVGLDAGATVPCCIRRDPSGTTPAPEAMPSLDSLQLIPRGLRLITGRAWDEVRDQTMNLSSPRQRLNCIFFQVLLKGA